MEHPPIGGVVPPSRDVVCTGADHGREREGSPSGALLPGASAVRSRSVQRPRHRPRHRLAAHGLTKRIHDHRRGLAYDDRQRLADLRHRVEALSPDGALSVRCAAQEASAAWLSLPSAVSRGKAAELGPGPLLIAELLVLADDSHHHSRRSHALTLSSCGTGRRHHE